MNTSSADSLSRPAGPWSGEDAVRLVVTNAIGLTLVLAAAYQSAGTSSMRTSLAWLSVGVTGLVAGGVATGLWLLRGLRSIGEAGVGVVPRRLANLARAEHGDADPAVVSVTGMARYHRRSCPMVEGKAMTERTRQAFDRQGLSACGICEP